MDTGKGSFERLATQWIELNLRYYRAVGEATVDYLRSVAAFAGDRAPALRNMVSRTQAAATGAAPMRPAQSAQPVPEASTAPAPTHHGIVLEAAGGEEAAGGFVVNNRLNRRVSAAFRVFPFTGPDGEAAGGLVLRIDPPVVTLDPGGQAVVRLGASIGDDLQPGVDYRGAISVPGLADAPIDVVVRRRAGAAPRPSATPKPRKRAKSAAARTSRPSRGRR